uniref:Uncharacterized protein n=1 Tax=Ciona intestinalis TaxID=7719 RepID=H2XR01_CIOIN
MQNNACSRKHSMKKDIDEFTSF